MSVATSVGREERTQVERTREARENIIRAAFVCIGKRGYHNTALTDIAREARVSRELPRYHFGSKEGLVMALLTELVSYWADLFSGHGSGVISIEEALLRLETMLTERFETMCGHAALMFGATDPTNGTLKSQSLAAQHMIHGNLLQVFERVCRAKPSLVARIDPNTYTSMVFTTFRGLVYQASMGESPEEIGKVWREFNAMILDRISR